LGAKKVESAQSAAEQAKLQAGGEEEGRVLAELNEEYERTFPGLRFVVWVNGRGRGEIMEIMRERIERGDWEGERDGAVEVSSYFFLLC
jgi:2-oxo-4-hydroxy-4-carboxy--5-ureidoimidazoline (OHCU) decarboxylase